MRAFAALLGGAFASASPTFYVDCSSGSDSGAGSSSSPWFSLFRAQTAVRAAPAGATVYIRGDCYPRDASGAFDGAGSLLTLGPADSGSPGSPVKWAAWPGAPAPPRLLGGMAIPASAWSPAGAAAPTPGTLMADLGAGGVNVARWGLGSLAGNGLGQCVDTMAELFFNGTPQFLARYPNVDPSGAWEWLGIEKVADKENAFYVNGTGAEHALQWPTATDAASSAWVHGYWRCVCKKPPRARARAQTSATSCSPRARGPTYSLRAIFSPQTPLPRRHRHAATIGRTATAR